MTESFSRVVEIKAAPEVVFDHFLDPKLLVTWMGDYARLDAREGGVFSVDINGVLIRGEYKRIDRPNRIEILWGEAGNQQMPPGATHLLIEIVKTDEGSELTLTHSGLVPHEAKGHATGWDHFLSRLVLTAQGIDPGADPWSNHAPA